MCKTCYIAGGAPKILTERTKAAAALVTEVYDWGGLGGNAQTVIDDWNVDNQSINHCLPKIEEDKKSPPERLQKEEDCLEALRHLTLDERLSALAIHHEFI